MNMDYKFLPQLKGARGWRLEAGVQYSDYRSITRKLYCFSYNNPDPRSLIPDPCL